MRGYRWVIGLFVLLGTLVVALFYPRAPGEDWRVPGPDCRVVIPVFVLHRVLPGEATEYMISPAYLEAMLDELNTQGFTPITLADLHAALIGEGALPARPAMLTFDDTYLDNYTYALPLLKSHGWTAAFFAPTGFLTTPPEERKTFGDGPEPYVMQWPEIHALQAAGMEIGSHSVSHVNLRNVPMDTLVMELEKSRMVLEERLGQAPIALAYPGGRQNQAIRGVAHDAGYKLAFLSGGDFIDLREEQDLLRLPRVHAPGYIDPRALVRGIPDNDWKR